ncbi:MAG: crosslink repair DNA glycosylase YcaQ family protein [Chloroflexota bacterium]
MKAPIKVTPTVARRLSITRQRLAGPRPAPTPEGFLEVVHDIGCLQLDPISAVARTNHLVPWSRLGVHDPAIQDTLLWSDRSLFEYWAHAASIVLTEDYPIHSHQMERYRTSDKPWVVSTRAWMAANQELYDHIMATIRERGPILSKDIEDKAQDGWQSTGWTGGRNVSRMLDFLWTQGIIMVAGRKGGQKMWDLAERVLPEWTPREELPQQEVVRRSALKSLRGLGIGTQRHITNYFTRNRYWDLDSVLRDLVAEGIIQSVEIDAEGKKWAGPWYVHRDDLHLLESLSGGGEAWQPRTTLLSPFDNLIADRARTEALFNFDFRIEIYVPKEQRKYGYYVLPILYGDRLIGRIDPLMDRKAKRLNINAVYAEPDAPLDSETATAIASSIAELAAFLGANQIAYGDRMPEGWRLALTSPPHFS